MPSYHAGDDVSWVPVHKGVLFHHTQSRFVVDPPASGPHTKDQAEMMSAGLLIYSGVLIVYVASAVLFQNEQLLMTKGNSVDREVIFLV